MLESIKIRELHDMMEGINCAKSWSIRVNWSSGGNQTLQEVGVNKQHMEMC